ncbi:MAG: hypothetical protein E7295_03920 [Lachnospiraceae bacterium]|nr:hypothetical protein [Lachnospiraceae bacterium]
MIYFNNYYIYEACSIIHESKEFFDLKEDLSRIDEKIKNIQRTFINHTNDFEVQEVLRQARELDEHLRRKYPTINKMLKIANSLPIRSRQFAPKNVTTKPTEVVLLEQDIYGILCDTILKKGVTRSIEEIIEYVEE